MNKKDTSGQWRSFSKITTEITIYRDAKTSDIPSLNDIDHEENQTFFGIPNFEHYIEYSMYQKLLEDNEHNIVGFMTINNYPNVKALLPSNWLEWMKYHYNLPSINYANTLFIEYMIADYLCDPNMFTQLFEDIFLKYPKLKYICTVSSSKLVGIYDEIMNIYATKHLPKLAHKFGQVIYIAYRNKYISTLKFRKAMAADNDELVDMLDEKYPENRKNFGDFYIAEEMLQGDNTTRSIIVMEQNDKNLGVMLLNTEVNTKYLYENFELSIYDNLKKICSVCSETKFIQKRDIIKEKSEEFFHSLSELVPGEYNDDLFLKSPNHLNNSARKTSLNDIFGSYTEDSTESVEELDIRLHSQIFVNSTMLYQPIDTRTIKAVKKMGNIFTLECFGLKNTLDPRRIFELLVAAFATYPDREYCFYLIETNESLEYLLTFFTRVPPRTQCVSNQSLYVTHRNIILGYLNVYLTTFDDLIAIQILLETENPEKPMKLCNEVFDLIWDSLTNIYSYYKSICITSNNNLVGIAVLCIEDRQNSFKDYYMLDDFINDEVINDESVHGRLLYLYIHPMFDAESAFIFSEITRLTGYQNIYYSLELDIDTYILNLYNNLLPEMFPVLPADLYKVPSYSNTASKTQIDNKESNELEPFPLYFQSCKLAQDPRKNIDTKIITIGFDEVCKGFLIKLIFGKTCRKYKFTSITIINQVEHISLLNMKQIQLLLDWPLVLGYEYLKRLGLHVWYNIISVPVKNILRASKHITFMDGHHIKYDKLFLLCSVLYGLPANLPFKNCMIPVNYILINSSNDCALIYKKIRILQKVYPRGFEIVIYGNTIRLYCALNFLLQHGIAGENMHFVVQSKDRNDELNSGAFSEDTMHEEMLDILRKSNVNIYENYHFYRWKVENNFILSMTFESKLKFITIPCKIVVNGNRKVIFRKMTTIFKQAGLVMDGRLVIDKNFKLNDPHIYAAGPITQYKRILFASKYDHIQYTNLEIGKMLGKKFFNELYKKKDKKFNKIPIPVVPRITQVFLPGGYLYMAIKRPGLRLPHKIAKLLSNYGTILATGRKEPDGSYKKFTGIRKARDDIPYSEYFRIRINDKGYMDSLICLTRRIDQPLHHLIPLFDCNEKLLNNIRKRYELGQINDFLEFFCRDWVKDLLNNKFLKVLKENKTYLRNVIENDTFSNSLLNKQYKGNVKIITDNDRKSLKNTLTKEETVKELEESFMTYKRQNAS